MYENENYPNSMNEGQGAAPDTAQQSYQNTAGTTAQQSYENTAGTTAQQNYQNGQNTVSENQSSTYSYSYRNPGTNTNGAFASDYIGGNRYQYTSNGTQGQYTGSGTQGQYTGTAQNQYNHFQMPGQEQMTSEQKKAQSRIDRAARRAETKHMKAEKKKAKKESASVKYRYPLGKRILAGAVSGVLFGAAAFGAFYGIEQATGLTVFYDGSNDQASAAVSNTPITNTTTGAGTADSTILTTENSTAEITDARTVAKNVMPAVVSIINDYTVTSNYWGQNYTQPGQASGSGIIVGQNDSELLIATNYHVIENEDTLTVTFIDDSTAEADVKGTDATNDLAVIAVRLDKLDASTKAYISVATLGDSDSLEIGQRVIAIGNALGYGQSVTQGIVSALNRQVEEDGGYFIQTDAAINPGNSGGALLNSQGQVIGINSAKIGGSTVEGMGYAIPISTAEPILEDLMSQSTKVKVDEEEKGYLGIAGVSVSADVSQIYSIPTGVYVSQVYEGTAAEKAGLQKGDVITELDGSSIDSMETLQKMLTYYAVGTNIELTVKRAANGYETETVQLTLGEKFTGDAQD